MTRSVWDGDWLPATKETPMPAEPVDASGRTRADRAEDLTHADSVRRLGPPTVISLDRLTKLAEQAIADHSVCVNEGCPGERIIPPSLRWFVEDYLPAALADGAAPRASQAATDEPELTAAARSVLAAQNGERCIHVDPHQGHQCTLTAGHDIHIANGGGWTLLPGEDDVLPVRASQAATATNGPGGDAGAAHDPHKPAAGRTEPRMRPEDVPDDIWQIARHAFADIGPGPDGSVRITTERNPWTALRDAIAAVIPAIGEHLATAIEENPMSECSGAVAECARLVRNLTRGDQ